ncbi:2-hydroxyacid dehydrogenase [Gudongella sp. DL1XJH-153]|uniref:2-hydroxyacid dehydrogenase n=1 Tax=Gudongella sp. DL1XJH-153 TaxID=3409804 RepID=UPI003BB6B50F
MDKPKVFIANEIPREAEEYIGEHCDYIMWDFTKKKTFQEIVQQIKDVDGILEVGMKIDHELLKHAPKLKVASNISVGYNNFNIEDMKEMGVLGTNTPGVLDNTVADIIFGLIISSARRIVESDADTKAGNWEKGQMDKFFGKDVHHSTLGIIGMGRIGEAVAKRALGFDMDIIYYNRNRKPHAEEKFKAEYMEMDKVIQNADFLVVMTPLNDETHHLIGERELQLMKKDAFLINASRGPVVDEKALIKALQEEWIAGAGLDVYEKEPIDKKNPLLSMKNVVTLPHIGSGTKKTRDEMGVVAAKALVEVLQTGDSEYIVPELRNEKKED